MCGTGDSTLKYLAEGYRIVRCSRCRFVYRQNNPSTGDTKDLYDDYHESIVPGDYDRNGSLSSLWHINQKRLNWIRRFHNGGRLLDIGCGRGFFLQHARQRGFDVRGFEISNRAASYAVRHMDLPVITGDLEKSDKIDGLYDVITFWHVLEHLTDPVTALKKARQSLARNGTIYIEVPNLNSIRFRLARADHRWIGGNHPRFHLSFFTLKTLTNTLERSGLSLYRSAHIVYGNSEQKYTMPAKKLLKYLGLDSFLTICARRKRSASETDNPAVDIP